MMRLSVFTYVFVMLARFIAGNWQTRYSDPLIRSALQPISLGGAEEPPE
jgi:hypothetical protein